MAEPSPCDLVHVMSAAERWRRMVEEEHAQSDSVRPEPPPEDHWAPYAAGFAEDPHRTGDILLERLAQHLRPEDTLLDVGAGGGRYAMALALRCSHVTAVEPSASMVAVLRQYSAIFRIANLSVVQSTWEEAQVPPADVVICVHVLYVVRQIEAFLRKLETHARHRVMVVMHQVPPPSFSFPIWEWVYGQPRLGLPCVPQLLEVLEELGINANVETLPGHPPRIFDSPERAMDQLQQRLYLEPSDAPRMKLLEHAMEYYLEEVEGGYRVRGAPDLVPHVIWWEPR